MRRFKKKKKHNFMYFIFNFFKTFNVCYQNAYELPLSCGKERDHGDYDVFTDAIFSFQLHIFK